MSTPNTAKMAQINGEIGRKSLTSIVKLGVAGARV